MLYYYRRQLIQLFKALQQLKSSPSNLTLCFDIQDSLIDKIRAAEKKVRRANWQMSELNRRIKTGRLPREQTVQLKALLSTEESKKDFYHWLISIYRDIGDGIPFIYLNKWDIKPLVLAKEPPGFLSKKSGLRMELGSYRVLRKRKIPGVLNDITHSIRHGDIALFLNGDISLIEIKSGKSSSKNERAARQIKRANAILEYLKTDAGHGIYPNLGETLMRRHSISRKEKNHQVTISEMLKEVRLTNTGITRKIEPGLFYNISYSEDDFKSILAVMPKSAIPLVFFVNQLKQTKQGYYPFTLSLNDANGLFDFYNGEVMITVLIDYNYLERAFDRKGYSLELLQGDEKYLRLVSKSDKLEMYCSGHFFGRVPGEFLSLHWFINEMASRHSRVFDEN